MRVVDLSKVNYEQGGIIAFGFFDSIHVGHQKVIGDAVRLAKEKGVQCSVYMFRNNIFPLLGIDKSPIFTFEERLSFIEPLGVDCVYYVDADNNYLSLSPSDFVKDITKKLSVDGFSCGKDFTFGAGGKGSVNDLITMIGGTFAVSDLMTVDGQKVSTERVKTALAQGDLKAVRRFLGREFSLSRNVVKGRNDGVKMGFPTINNELLSVPIKEGVYFTQVSFGQKIYKAVTNVGAHPTFDDGKRNIESYLLDFDSDVYGAKSTVTFLKFHREIVKFDSIEALKRTIENDVLLRRKYD